MNKLYRLVCSFVSVVCLVFSAYADGVGAGMQYFDDVSGDTPIVTNAWANVSNKVHSLIQVVSPKTDISGKQDNLPYPTNAIPFSSISGVPSYQEKLPYPTNAIPYDVITNVPKNDLITDGTNIVYSSLEVFRQSEGLSDWTVEWYIDAPSKYEIFYSNVLGLQDEWVLDLQDGGMPYLSGVTDINATEAVFRGIAKITRMHDGWNYVGKLATTNDVGQMISGKADEVIDKWVVVGGKRFDLVGQPRYDGGAQEWYWNDSDGNEWFAIGDEDKTFLTFNYLTDNEFTAQRGLRVLRTGEAVTMEQLDKKQDKLPYPTNNIPVSAVNGAVDDSQIATINHRIDTIEMSSRPNINVVGSPIFSQGNVSGFSANDYLIFPSNVSVGTNTVVFNMMFTTGYDITTKQNILDSAYGLAFAISNGYTITYISYDGNSFIPSRSETAYIAPNTSYNLRLIFRKVGGNYFTDTYVGTRLTNMQKRGSSIQTGMPIVAKPTYWGGANPQTEVHNIFNGTINLNECNLWFNDVRVWSGYDAIQNDYVSFDPTADRVLNTADKIVEAAGQSASKGFNDWRTNDLKVVLGNTSEVLSSKGMAIGLPTSSGRKTSAGGGSSIAIGIGAQTAPSAPASIAFGANASANAQGAVQIGQGVNTVSNSLKFMSHMIVDGNGKIYSSALPDEINRPYTMIYDQAKGRALTADGKLCYYGNAPKISGKFIVTRNGNESYSDLPNGAMPTLALLSSDELVDGADWTATVTPSSPDGNGGYYVSTANITWRTSEYGNSILPLQASIEKTVSSFGTQTTLYLNSYGYTYYEVDIPDVGVGEVDINEINIDGNKVTMNWSFYDYNYWNYYSGTDVFDLTFEDDGGEGVQAVAFGDLGRFATLDDMQEMVSSSVENSMNGVDTVRSSKKYRANGPLEYGDGWGYLRYDFASDKRWWEVNVPNITATITANNYPFNQSGLADRIPYLSERNFLRSSGTNNTDRCLSSVWDLVVRIVDVDLVLGTVVVSNGYGVTSITPSVPSGTFWYYSSSSHAQDLAISSITTLPSTSPTINISYTYNWNSSAKYNGSISIRLNAPNNSYTKLELPYFRNVGGENHHMYWDEAMKCTWNVAVSNGSFFAEIVSTNNLLSVER